jgi:hypothetical protein
METTKCKATACEAGVCRLSATNDLGRYQRFTGLVGEVRYVCDACGARHGLVRPSAYAGGADAALGILRGDAERTGKPQSMARIERVAAKYGVNPQELAAALSA